MENFIFFLYREFCFGVQDVNLYFWTVHIVSQATFPIAATSCVFINAQKIAKEATFRSFVFCSGHPQSRQKAGNVFEKHQLAGLRY